MCLCRSCSTLSFGLLHRGIHAVAKVRGSLAAHKLSESVCNLFIRCLNFFPDPATDGADLTRAGLYRVPRDLWKAKRMSACWATHRSFALRRRGKGLPMGGCP